MKNLNRKNKKIIPMLLLASMAFGLSTYSNKAEAYEGIKVNECTVFDENDGVSGRKGPTLRHSLYFANKSKSKDQRCRHAIHIASPIINLDQSLTLSVQNIAQNGVPSTRTNGDVEYIIDGRRGGVEGELITLNANNILAAKDSDPTKNCVLNFTNTSNITLRNIIVTNVPVGFSAICFDASANSIILDNVHISQVKGGHGIVIHEGSSENIIKSSSSIEHVQGDGIHVLSTGLGAHNALDATDRPLGDSFTDANGTANFSDPTALASDFSLRAISGKFIHSKADAHIKLSLLAEEGAKKWRIEGAVVKNEETCVPFTIDTMDQNLLQADISRLQVYAVGIRAEGESGGQSAVFLTYVGKQSDCAGEDCFNGIVEGSDPTNNYNRNGIFKFVLDTSIFVERINKKRASQGLSSIEEIKQIVLVPEMDNLTVASSSKIITLRSGNTTDIVDVCENDNGGGAGGAGSGGNRSSSDYIWLGYKTKNACGIQKNRGQQAPRGYDSDGDGLEDRLEDKNGDCSCEGDISCWDNSDSDGDGISDSLELSGLTESADPTGTSDLAYCATGEIPGTPLVVREAGQPATREIVTDLCDVDGDGDSNAKDEDSDGDGIPDYIEDRKRGFSLTREAHYYLSEPGSNRDPILYKDKDDKPVACQDYLARKGKVDRGIALGLFKIKRDPSQRTVPVSHEFSGQIGDDEILFPMACRSLSVREASNFNGRLDGESESHVYSQQTKGPSCLVGGSADNDNCPSDQVCRGGKIERGKCVLNCENREVLKNINISLDQEEDYFEMAGEERVRLKMVSDSEGNLGKSGRRMPKLFLDFAEDPNSLKAVCGDLDGDGIPSCVELSSGVCDDLTSHAGEFLSPYSIDSDKDTFSDGPTDIGTATDKDPYSASNTRNSRDVYDINPMLAFFIDRDGDQIMDGDEDRNLDGDYIPSDDQASTETDPMEADSDDDGIGDYVESVLWGRYTNPARKDTDGDGLFDGEEVVIYPENIRKTSPAPKPSDIDYVDTFNDGCNNIKVTIQNAGTNPATRYGTNPNARDTDGDGIEDGAEVRGEALLSAIDEEILKKILTGLPIQSNPLSSDSDGDGLTDAEEVGLDGVMDITESNPCVPDSDGDGKRDNLEEQGTRLLGGDDSQVCENGGMVNGFRDSDCDGVSDVVEVKLTTDPNDRDWDNDGLLDGEEDLNGDGQIQIQEGETNPKEADTDGDGLSDGEERSIGLKPHVGDSDGDGISDGIELGGVRDPASSKITGASIHNYGTGGFLDPTNPDTDGDGLCDGRSDRGSVRDGGLTGDVSCQFFEDRNNDGKRDLCEFGDKSQFCGTDPLNPDSDLDGAPDLQEMTRGGQFSLSNAPSAVQGRQEGCFSIAGNSQSTPTSLFYLFGMLLLWNRWSARNMKMKETKN